MSNNCWIMQTYRCAHGMHAARSRVGLRLVLRVIVMRVLSHIVMYCKLPRGSQRILRKEMRTNLACHSFTSHHVTADTWDSVALSHVAELFSSGLSSQETFGSNSK